MQRMYYEVGLLVAKKRKEKGGKKAMRKEFLPFLLCVSDLVKVPMN